MTHCRQPATIKLGLHGIPNSGKTSLLIAWYLYRENHEFNLNIRFDEESRLYLRSMADEARRYLQSCNAVLTLADARAIDHRVIDAIDILPSPCCVIFVPTKIDELLEDPEQLLRLRANATDEVYQSILQSEPIAEIHRLFRQRLPKNKYRIAPLSALGPVFRDGQLRVQPPLKRDALRPWNVYHPLRLVVDASQRQLNETARELSRQLDTARHQLRQLEDRQREQHESQRRAEELASLQRTKCNHELQDRLDRIREDVQIASVWDQAFRSSTLVSMLDQLAREAATNQFQGVADGARSLASGLRGQRVWWFAASFLVILLLMLLMLLKPVIGF